MKKSEFRSWATWRVLPITLAVAMASGLNAAGSGATAATEGTASAPAISTAPTLSADFVEVSVVRAGRGSHGPDQQ